MQSSPSESESDGGTSDDSSSASSGKQQLTVPARTSQRRIAGRAPVITDRAKRHPGKYFTRRPHDSLSSAELTRREAEKSVNDQMRRAQKQQNVKNREQRCEGHANAKEEIKGYLRALGHDIKGLYIEVRDNGNIQYRRGCYANLKRGHFVAAESAEMPSQWRVPSLERSPCPCVWTDMLFPIGLPAK